MLTLGWNKRGLADTILLAHREGLSLKNLRLTVVAVSLLSLTMTAWTKIAWAETFPLDGADVDSLGSLPLSHLPASLTGVEATNLRATSSVAYVTYNSAGAASSGAFEAVDFSDIRHPRALGILKYSDTEFADLAVEGQVAYVVGQINDSVHQGAVLKVIDISCPEHLRDMGNVYLSGYAATSIQIKHGQAIVSVGDNSGVQIFQLDDDGLPKLANTLAVPNALDSVLYHGDYLALGGEGQTSLYAYRHSDLSPVTSIGISDQTSPSPARFQVRRDFGYINDERSGLNIVDLSVLSDGKITLSSKTAVPGTGNGLDVRHHFVFLAQGEAGLYVVDARDKSAPKILGNLDFHYTGESTNQVRAIRRFEWWPFGFHEYLLVANGSGGFRTFELRRH
jgi:hypothetical protein